MNFLLDDQTIPFEIVTFFNFVVTVPAELAYQAEATTGEGSIWHPERHTLFWVDIEGQTLYEYHPDTKECSSWKFDRMVSTVVPETDSTVIIALQNEIVRDDIRIMFALQYPPRIRCDVRGAR